MTKEASHDGSGSLSSSSENPAPRSTAPASRGDFSEPSDRTSMNASVDGGATVRPSLARSLRSLLIQY